MTIRSFGGINIEIGRRFSKGQALLVLESSKASFDVESPESGYFYHQLQEQTEVVVGETLGYLAASAIEHPEELFRSTASSTSHAELPAQDILISKEAQTLMRTQGLSSADFANYTSISKADVLKEVQRRAAQNRKFPDWPSVASTRTA